jgi:metal-responsive CopG/Arc/MetJ family transcriptional regulator
MTWVMLRTMKTAVSIPEAIFQAAERMARRWGISRSELYAKAVQRYLEEHSDEPVTELVNAVCDKIDTSLDPGLRRIQSKSLPRDEWK